jgi:hypothetical protein
VQTLEKFRRIFRAADATIQKLNPIISKEKPFVEVQA